MQQCYWAHLSTEPLNITAPNSVARAVATKLLLLLSSAEKKMRFTFPVTMRFPESLTTKKTMMTNKDKKSVMTDNNKKTVKPNHKEK